jgi:group I intron endonuclease
VERKVSVDDANSIIVIHEPTIYKKMSDTRAGNIYKIICSKSNDVYVGSSFNALRTRMEQHKSSFRQSDGLAKYPTFKRHGWKSLKMIHIETYQVVDRRHLEMYEQLWCNRLKSINIAQPFNILTSLKGSSQTLRKKAAKKRQQDLTANKAISERYRKTVRQQHLLANKLISERYRETARQVSKEKREPCECGGSYITRVNRDYIQSFKHVHIRSNQHKEWLQSRK